MQQDHQNFPENRRDSERFFGQICLVEEQSPPSRALGWLRAVLLQCIFIVIIMSELPE